MPVVHIIEVRLCCAVLQ